MNKTFDNVVKEKIEKGRNAREVYGDALRYVENMAKINVGKVFEITKEEVSKEEPAENILIDHTLENREDGLKVQDDGEER